MRNAVWFQVIQYNNFGFGVPQHGSGLVHLYQGRFLQQGEPLKLRASGHSVIDPEEVFEDQINVAGQRSSVGSGFLAGKSNLTGVRDIRGTVVEPHRGLGRRSFALTPKPVLSSTPEQPTFSPERGGEVKRQTPVQCQAPLPRCQSSTLPSAQVDLTIRLHHYR
jgi:hypothetical protein